MVLIKEYVEQILEKWGVKNRYGSISANMNWLYRRLKWLDTFYIINNK